MNNLFFLFLSLSISGSILALILLLLKPLIKDRFSQTWQYYIWLVVILRFLLPLTLPVSITGEAVQYVRNAVDRQAVTAVAETTGNIADQGAEALPETVDTTQNKLSAEPAASLPSVRTLLSDYAWAVWAGAALLLFSGKLYSYLRFHRFIRKTSEPVNDSPVLEIYQQISAEAKLKKPLPLYQNTGISTPMLVGTIRPVIVIPPLKAGSHELANIFRHELTHYRRLDAYYKWLVQIALCLHWFNPVVYLAGRQISQYCELSCDESVIRSLDQESRMQYGDALIASLQVQQQYHPAPGSITMSKDAGFVKERLDKIMNFKKKTKLTISISILAAFLLISGAALAGAYPPPGNSGTGNVTAVTDEQTPADRLPKQADIQLPVDRADLQTVVYDAVEMRRYEGDDGHPYIHEIKTNHTAKEITGWQRIMLAFDSDGNPLAIDWFSLDTSLEPSYSYLHSNDSDSIAPGETEDRDGGWSLDFFGIDPAVADIAYVLYCDMQITFADGTVWDNPDFDEWRSTYEGQKVDPAVLESYYPYVQNIEL